MRYIVISLLVLVGCSDNQPECTSEMVQINKMSDKQYRHCNDKE